MDSTWSRGKLPIELLFWVSGLVLLFFMNPHNHHMTLCPLGYAGFEWCPGCGLGRSISLFMHGELNASLRMHWLGMPAFFIIAHRIFVLSKGAYHSLTNNYLHEQP